jgi:CBS domain-containing protein
MNADQLMTKNVKTCSMNDTLEVAARIMWENDCGVVPIVDQDGRAVGMITDRDICMAGFTQGLQYWQIPVSVAASKTLLAIRPTDSLQNAEEIMRARQVRRLAVTDDSGKLLGVLSLNDLARHAGRRADDLGLDEVTKTLSAICQRPRPSSAVATKEPSTAQAA